ncbi:ABC transporter permease subunit [Clostridiaceae bacterium UIB06]|uniref:ABC transporter permease subunit n=1 Tax=Clostridium thailandense TaxID=2794346 RepID=A0A949U571_9CLOT|nr:glycine betaine ABC transporter substrate-binding protein [Clostridium thailandense]MBV7276659.1 ABC transporter permease subunit [Clostridium thailandense]MCH5138700.1 ABC transporter permease subunit [Clostridiaceae bacterium UIB06]
MNNFKTLIEFFIDRKEQIYSLFLQHIQLTVLAVVISIAIGVPLGVLITRVRKLSGPVIGVANIMQSIPSLALLGFLIPLLGIGSKPAITMVVLYSLLPIVKNTFTGMENINAATLEAAEGIGLTKSQILIKIQLPLALPVIMSGIRISAVTAVGLMTIAAFIGAGGLGYLVFSGVQTVNSYMILAGAIPACLLALVLDFIIGRVEMLVIPDGIKVSSTRTKSKNKFIASKKFKLAAAILVVVIIGGSVFKSFVGNKKEIVIGSKNFNEQLVLGNILASLIENNTDYKVEKKLNLGGTSVVFNAIKSGDIDMYVEYTGTGLVDIMKQNVQGDQNKVYNMVSDYFKKNYGIDWLKPLGFNNTYALAVKQDLANRYNLNTISDLANVSKDLKLGSTMEFINRADGLIGLSKAYNLQFKSEKGIDGGLRYSALEDNSTQVIDAFSTDGLLQKFKLKLLKDDKSFFPPYYAVPIVREDTLKKYPELKPLLNKLEGVMDDETMQKLNYKVDNGEEAEKVANDFLKEKGLI